MNEVLDIWENPSGVRYMIAGWHQWADAGSVSSGLPAYLIRRTRAKRIGLLKPAGFYLFQIPGAHHLLRPIVELQDGHRKGMSERKNEVFHAQSGQGGVLIFLGTEPHCDEDRYSDAFLDMAEELGVERIVIFGGVHGPVPYDRNREFSCIYSHPRMRDELTGYAVRFSDYEGGSTIGAYLAHKAEKRDVEVAVFYAMVPSYQFSGTSVLSEVMSMDEDYKAWYDLMRRICYMSGFDLDLSDLSQRADAMKVAWEEQLEQLEIVSALDVTDYLEMIDQDFTERTFEPLSRAWEDALGDIFEDS
ncbi:MAG: PAC2 family protein [Anaerolineae bacterium]|nr:PAC2 family protein [Anaerolineae bacterium]